MKNINFLFLSTILWLCSALPACADEQVASVTGNASSPILVELGKQVKEALHEYGFPDSVINDFSFSGPITIGTPKALPKPVEVVSQKYSCTVECNIQVLDIKSNALICQTAGTFDDIGRTPGTARKYALGKVVKPLFKCIKEKSLQLKDMDDIFKTLEQEEAIVEQHIEDLSSFVDGIVDKL